MERDIIKDQTFVFEKPDSSDKLEVRTLIKWNGSEPYTVHLLSFSGKTLEVWGCAITPETVRQWANELEAGCKDVEKQVRMAQERI